MDDQRCSPPAAVEWLTACPSTWPYTTYRPRDLIGSVDPSSTRLSRRLTPIADCRLVYRLDGSVAAIVSGQPASSLPQSAFVVVRVSRYERANDWRGGIMASDRHGAGRCLSRVRMLGTGLDFLAPFFGDFTVISSCIAMARPKYAGCGLVSYSR